MCQLFVSKDFETSLLTLLGVSLVLWRRKADNAHSNPLFYGPSPLNSQHLHFQFPIASLLKIFVRIHRDRKKKCREGSRQRVNMYHTLHSYSPSWKLRPAHSKQKTTVMKYKRDWADISSRLTQARHIESRYSRWLWQQPNTSKKTKKLKLTIEIWRQ